MFIRNLLSTAVSILRHFVLSFYNEHLNDLNILFYLFAVKHVFCGLIWWYVGSEWRVRQWDLRGETWGHWLQCRVLQVVWDCETGQWPDHAAPCTAAGPTAGLQGLEGGWSPPDTSLQSLLHSQISEVFSLVFACIQHSAQLLLVIGTHL